MNLTTTVTSLVFLTLTACSDVEDDHHHHHHEHEVITTVVLTFTPQSNDAEALVFTWTDAENDGSPVIDDIVLQNEAEYALTVAFLNELEEPAEDITPEIADEDDEHQVFFTGSAVQGPASTQTDAIVEHAYADQDANGLAVGLDNTMTSLQDGSGEFIVTLRHMPQESNSPVKTEGAAEDVADGGFAAIGGENDIQVTFPLAVEPLAVE
jgi:hypothetical protein